MRVDGQLRTDPGLRDAYESALDEAERLRDDYHREIVKLHRSGMSLREIAEGLGISHQRVHQIVSPHEEGPRSKAKRVAAGGAVAAIAVVVGAAVLLSRGDPPAPVVRSMAPEDQSRSICVVTQAGPSATPITLAADCAGPMFWGRWDAQRGLRPGSIVAIDAETGDVIAVAAGSHRVLRGLVLRVDCAEPGCVSWAKWMLFKPHYQPGTSGSLLS